METNQFSFVLTLLVYNLKRKMLENEARGCLVWSLLVADFKTFFIFLPCVLSNMNVYEHVLSLKIASLDLLPFRKLTSSSHFQNKILRLCFLGKCIQHNS